MSLTLKRFVNHFLLDSFYRTMTRVKHSSMKFQKKLNAISLAYRLHTVNNVSFFVHSIAVVYYYYSCGCYRR